MSQKRLTTNGNVFRRTDGRWQSVIWYFDEQGIKRRKVFSSKTKTEAQQKITTYIWCGIKKVDSLFSRIS